MPNINHHRFKTINICLFTFIISIIPINLIAENETPPTSAKVVGHIENRRIIECSGLETSPNQNDLLWAINDGNNGPYLYALGGNGRHRGRFRISGAINRDWEGLDTFRWKNTSYILIADIGDNRQIHASHHLYIIKEPRLNPEKKDQQSALSVARRIVFRYPDGRHDGEGVAVDVRQEKILIVTKRDSPPLLFELPLFPPQTTEPITAKLVGELNGFQKPTQKDMSHRYGAFRSQPTAMDISDNGLQLVLLTYKHAYLLSRKPSETWATALTHSPQLIPLPLPEETPDLRQRESVCFKNAVHPMTIIVTAEGMGAGIYHVVAPSNQALPKK